MSSSSVVSAFDHLSVNPKIPYFLQENVPNRTFNHQSRMFSTSPSFHRVSDSDKNVNIESEGNDFGRDEVNDFLVDSMLWDTNVKLIKSGFARHDSTEDIVMFVNCGGEASIAVDCAIKIMGDTSFEGGDVLRTSERINDAGDYPYIYQSARVGNFCYQLRELPSGSYFVDLHFSEIINTNGPKGMRVFNVFLQEEKVLSEFDVFSIVGSNKPLQLVDMRVSLKEDGVLAIKFEGVNGNPIVSGICIRKAANNFEHIKCANCAADIEVSSMQTKLMRMKASEKYEKKIKELANECQHKAKECHEAWMSLTTANQQLEEVRMGLDNKIFQIISLDQIVGKQADNLRNMTRMHDHNKNYWRAMIIKLQEDVKIMKEEHSLLSHEAHDCLASIPKLNKMVLSIQAVVEQCEDFKLKYIEEHTKRKVLYNQIQETKGNIRVFCRCRPPNNDEILAGCAIVTDFDAAKDGDIGIILSNFPRKNFKFDRVYTPTDDQVDVFADALPLVTSFLDGYNVCIFAYGQTGTGKTFTMEGTELNRGVNYRTLEELFKIATERYETFTYNLSVSALEVYNEQIRDLLATSPTSKKLEIRQSSEGFHHVPGIIEAKVDTIKEVWNVLQVGSNARAIGSNNVNEHSSRSHCMLCVMVKAKNLLSGECTKSKLWLVDLAGSERLAKTVVQGERLKEAQNINKSLSALADVINALAIKGSHIPYRNSKLTHLLQDSLGGDAKTLMFVQISPSEQDLSETLSSLNFATRVRGVELGPAKKQIDTTELQKMKLMFDKARQESKLKDESLRKLEETLQNLETRGKSKDVVYRNMQEKIREVEAQLELKTYLNSQSEKQLSHICDRLKGREEICCNLQQKVKDLEAKLREQQQSESVMHDHKVKNLENKLKDQVQESEACTLILKQKIKELEVILGEKDKQLQLALLSRDAADMAKGTPNMGTTNTTDDESTGQVEMHILRNSNSVNQTLGVGFRGSDAIHQTLIKKRQSRNGELENNAMVASFSDIRGRKSEPPKVARIMRTRKPIVTAQEPPSSHKRGNRDQVQGPKERDPKKKIWSAR